MLRTLMSIKFSAEHIKILGSLCFILFAIYACQPPGVLTKEKLEAMGTASITLLHQMEPRFLVMTEKMMIQAPTRPGTIADVVTTALRGADTPEELGAAVQAKEMLLAPALHIQQIMAERMRERLPSAKIAELNDAQARTDPAEIRKMTDNDLAMSIGTIQWGLWPYPFDTSFHRLLYEGEAKLIDLRTTQVIWSTTCRYLGDAPRNHRPTLEDFEQDHATLLIAELKRAADVCAKRLLKQLN